jgi:hypothetical protein
MKSTLLCASLTCLPFFSFSQDTTTAELPPKFWKVEGLTSFTMSQTSLVNWQAGGENSITGNFLFKLTANYEKNKWKWQNSLEINLGATKLADRDWRKTDDRIELNTKVLRHLSKNWDYNAFGTFRTQFTEGFLIENDTITARISHILAPAYVLAGIGFTYKPVAWFSIDLSPLTSKTTIVRDQRLADIGAFGVKAAEFDEVTGIQTRAGEMIRVELGGYANIKLQKDIMENVSLQTKADFFSNYLENPQNIDITWDVLIVMKINKWLSANLTTNLIYDDDIKMATGTDANGLPTRGPRTQFKETFGAGLTVKF